MGTYLEGKVFSFILSFPDSLDVCHLLMDGVMLFKSTGFLFHSH